MSITIEEWKDKIRTELKDWPAEKLSLRIEQLNNVNKNQSNPGSIMYGVRSVWIEVCEELLQERKDKQELFPGE